MCDFKIKDSFQIKVGGKRVNVNFDGISYGIAIHFDFYGDYISSTGYRSYFLMAQDFISLGYTDYKKCSEDIANDLYMKFNEENLKEGTNIAQLELF